MHEVVSGRAKTMSSTNRREDLGAEPSAYELLLADEDVGAGRCGSRSMPISAAWSG